MIIEISGKCSDMASFRCDDAGVEGFGYAPYIQAIGGGDYIRMSIDNETGKIVGWKPLTKKQMIAVCEEM